MKNAIMAHKLKGLGKKSRKYQSYTVAEKIGLRDLHHRSQQLGQETFLKMARLILNRSKQSRYMRTKIRLKLSRDSFLSMY